MAPASRTVVCYRWRGALAQAQDAERYAEAAAAVLGRAEALGAGVVAWHAASFAVDFAPDDLDPLVALVAAEESQALGFSVGIAEGPLKQIGPPSATASRAFGPVLIRAWALARVARAGEVLLDDSVAAARDGRLLVCGSRIGVLGNARIRGARLDLRHPRQPGRGFPTVALMRSGYLGREPVLPPAGTLGIVSGRHGIGGTRWLEELAARERERRTLIVRPRLGETLGALRRALDRAREAMAELDPELASSLEGVLAGEGLDLETSVELLARLMRRETTPGLVLIDDAENVDADSLEAIAAACATGAFCVVARTVDVFALPRSLIELPRAFLIELEPLSSPDAAELVGRLTHGRFRGQEAARWAKRGSGLPIGIVGALADALEGGEIVTHREGLEARTPASGRGAALAPSASFARRARRWDPRVRFVLGALAVLGGDSDEAEIAALLALVHEQPPEESMLHAFEAADLIRRDGSRISLSSSTLRSALSEVLTDAERARLHRAASAVLAGSDLPLCSVAAAVHSMLGGDVDRALPMARRGAGALRAAGLEETAHALETFSWSGDPAPVRQRGLFSGARAERAGLQRSDVPPPPVAAPRQPPSGRGVGGEEAARRFVQALKQRDHAAMEILATELRSEGSQQAIADRLEGMASLARGQVSEALRLLRQAKQRAEAAPPPDRARAALALGVALASAGRGTEALLEGLEALARAREGADRHGETACARFLGRLTRAAANPAAAERWDAVAP